MATGNFSKDPDEALRDALERGYTGVRIEQGVPLLDRDLNLLVELPLFGLRQFVSSFGDGVVGDAFEIELTEDRNLAVQAGACFVGGTYVSNPRRLLYTEQADVPELPALADRLVYLEVTTGEADATQDPTLGNPDDVGMQTSIRGHRRWRVLVAVGEVLPPPPIGATLIPLALLRRPLGDPIEGGRLVVEDRRPFLRHAATCDVGFLTLDAEPGNPDEKELRLLFAPRCVLFLGHISVGPRSTAYKSPVVGVAAKDGSELFRFGLTSNIAATGLFTGFRDIYVQDLPYLGVQEGARGVGTLELSWDETNLITVSLRAYTAPAEAFLRYVAIP